MNFELTVGGINPAKVTKIEGERGAFYAADAGGRPELENGFYYGDDCYQFCFYVNLPPNPRQPNIFDFVIYHATNERLGQGGLFKAEKKDISYIENNIRKLFTTRSFFNVLREAAPPSSNILFTWNISK